MNSKVLALLLIITNLLSVLAQNSSNLDRTSIILDNTYPVKLQPNQTKTWVLTLQQQPNPTTDLFVTVQSPPNDPLQQPFLTIYTQTQSLQECYSANNEFSGVCRLDGSKLKANMTVFIQADCLVQCNLILYATLNQRYVLSLDNTLYLRAPQSTASQFQFEIQVPNELNFTQIAIFAQITDFFNATQGLGFYANVGDAKISVPNQTNYYVKGEPIFWGGEGLYFSKEDFQKGRIIKIYLSLSAGIQVKLYSKVTNGNDFVIALGESYFDYTSPKEPKKYFLDLSSKSKQIEGKALVVGFVVYGGNPTIKVAFDIEFKNTLRGIQKYGTINFVITQSLRKSLNFQGTIFISVNSQWNADYFMSSTLFEKNYISILPDTSYYTQVLNGQLFNYFFDQKFYYNPIETNLSSKQTFNVKINLIKGFGTFGIRRCKSAQANGSPLACVMSSINDLKNQTILKDFYQIPVIIKKTDQFHQMLFEYNLSLCNHIQVNKNTSAFYCFFHIVAAARNGDIEYTISLSKRKYASLLKEGQIVRDTIFQNEYIFYRFALSSLQNIKEIAIYITLIEGQAELLASTVDNYPEFDLQDPKLKTSNSKRIIYKADQLTKNIYVAVFGIDLSQFTIGVVVKRDNKDSNVPDSSNKSKDNNQISKISLNLGVTQQFVLKVDEEKASFQISPPLQGKFTIEVVQLVGNVEISVYSVDGKLLTCQDTTKTSTKIICSLAIKSGQSLYVVVSGKQGDQQKFVIVYYKADTCVPYNLNLPLYRELAANKSECIVYDITKASDLQLTFSASVAQLLHGNILLDICVNEKCRKAQNNRHHQLPKTQLEAICDFNKKESQSCFIRLNFTNNSTETLYFNLILEQKSVDVALFDGITETVTSSELSESKAKHFYYQVDSNTTIRIFFTSFTSNTYCILAHFISEKQFISNTTNIYISYQDKDSFRKKDNYYQFYKYSPGTSLYPILNDKLSSLCQNCMLTLSVYKLDSINSHSLAVFQVEVSQEETALVIGQSKIGFIEQDEIFVYQLQQPTSKDAVVSVKDLSKESSTQKNCFKLSISDADSFSQTSFLVIPKNSKKLTLFVTTESKVCQFQVSYSFSGGSILEASEGRSYNFQLNEKETAYFIFKHRTKNPFKIVTILNTGEVQISVSSLGTNQTWKQLLTSDPLNYPLVGDANEGEIMINSSSKVFCQNCSYAIAVTSQKGAKGEFLVTKINNTIPLSVKGLIRQKINITENKVRNYTFSSITTFNISINVIYGKVRVIVVNPENQTIKDFSINTSQVIRVKHSNSTVNYTFEFESIYATFRINVEAEVDSSYTIKASKIGISERIFQGIISYFQLKKNEPFIMEFLNLNKPAKDSATFNVLIEVVRLQEALEQPTINLTAIYSRHEGFQPIPLLPMNRIDSQSTINVQFVLQKGDYYLNLTSNQQTVASVLLVKQSLIHLKAQSSVIMSSPGIFELYSPFKSVMIEIFSCQGDLAIQATSDYSSFQSQKKDYDEIVLQQSNYGGHYVVSTTNVFGQYFIKVKNKGRQNNSILYLMNYYYYDQKDVLPYKIIDQVSPSITYSLTADSILFSIKSTTIKNQFKDYVKSANATYYLYVDSSRSKVSKFANCRLQKSVKVFNATGIAFDSIEFKVNFDNFQANTSIYFVGAEAVVEIVPSSTKDVHFPKQLNLIYDVIQITNSKLPSIKEHKTGISAQAIILWILLPFALAGLALFFAIKFCIKKYRGMVPDHFVEQKQDGQIQGQSGQAVSVKNRKASNASGTFNEEIQ